MAYQLSSDLVARIQAFLAGGQYATEEEVVRDALCALEQRQQDLAAIQAGVADMEAGRYRSFSEIDAEFRAKHRVPRDA
ncbi:MAG: type II toxin-antitoxin system ParD family antitoxin [Planctomycetia bacterium]|nr:type II toxin-antitoxin system ParD family antitoxin [Planctomycetia bacterium]